MIFVAIDGDLLQPLILLVLIFFSWILNTLAESKRKRELQRRPPPRPTPPATPHERPEFERFPVPTRPHSERRYRAPRPVPPPPPPQRETPHYRRQRKSVFDERPSSIPDLAPGTPPSQGGNTSESAARTTGIQFGLEVAGEMTGRGGGHRGSHARARQRLGLDGSPATGREALRRAVLLAEVLGPPRIRKPHRGPLRDATR